MDVKEAARVAKQHIAELFKEEGAKNIGLEEVEFDPTGIWKVTVGFSRPWNGQSESPFAFPPTTRAREMKVVTLDDADGSILSVRNRE